MKIMLPEKAQTKAIPYPEPMERPGIEPSDPMSEAGRKVMRYQFAEMLRHEKGTRMGEDIEALHDMRVATRRLRAAFEVFNTAFKPAALRTHLKGLRRTGRTLGSVRDLDVFMEKARRYLESLPEEHREELDPLILAWQAQRDSARSELLEYLDSESYFEFKRSFNIFIKTPSAGARKLAKDLPSPNAVRELAPVLIYQRLASVRSFDPYMQDAPLDRLHALRIEFKKLRYTVEYFREVLGEEAEPVIEDLKKMQDHLGDLNDANVASSIIYQFLERHNASQAKLPKSERIQLKGIEAYLQARQEELEHLRGSFPESWAYFKRPEFTKNLAKAVSAL
jgi:CHAD domain-containing protein